MPVIGVAKSGWNLEQFKARAHDSLEKHGGVDPVAFEKLCGLLRRQTSEGEIPERWPSRAGLTDHADPLIDRLAIENAVRMLPPGCRAAFILHDVQGYTHEEAGRLSGHTAGTSKSQLHKARARLRAVLSGRSPALQT